MGRRMEELLALSRGFAASVGRYIFSETLHGEDMTP